MVNLLESPLSGHAIASLLGEARRRPLLPPMDAPEWEATQRKPAVRQWMKSIQTRAETEAFRPLPPLPDELYALFYKTGERLPFETVYFERRKTLGRAAMVVLLGDPADRKRFAPALIEKIGDIMGEPSWTFPAHVWTEPSGKDPMMIDLFAAETANLMGELLTLFGSIIPDDLATRIRERLRVQIFDNYLRRHSEFTWTGLPMNWNAVCHQGVLGAALAVEEDTAILGCLLATASGHLPVFLSGFGNDGSTSEGPGYWSYGFGWFARLNEQLETSTDGALSFFGSNEKIRRIAAFAPALVFSNGYLVNFSDGHSRGTLPPTLLAYLGERLDMPLLRQESAALYVPLAAVGIDLDAQRCDTPSLTRLFLSCPESIGAAAEEPVRPDSYFEDYGAVVARGRDDRGHFLEFAAKGGHNDEHHNHNDCGSFILHVNGEPAVIEIGAPEYVHGYFSNAGRYDFLAARSLGHSVPFVNGCEQREGAQFAAKVIECEMGASHVKFALDLTKCYSTAARCRSLVRTFEFDKPSGCVSVADAFQFEETSPIESIVICKAPVRIDGIEARIDAPGGVLRVIPGDGTILDRVESCGYRDHGGNKQQVNRIRLRPAGLVAGGEVRYELRADGTHRPVLHRDTGQSK